jgi:hypothetical protein
VGHGAVNILDRPIWQFEEVGYGAMNILNEYIE